MSNRDRENQMQVPVTPEMTWMEWISENKLMVILVILIIAAGIWYFWYREDSGEISPASPQLTTPAATGGKTFSITRTRR
jgi:hypothetical protein